MRPEIICNLSLLGSKATLLLIVEQKNIYVVGLLSWILRVILTLKRQWGFFTKLISLSSPI